MIRTLYFCLAFSLLGFVSEVLAAKNKKSGPVPVIVAPVKVSEFADRVEALGTTKANETVVITAETSEKVTTISFDDGQKVHKDSVLLTLDKSSEEAELKSAVARKLERRSAYDRAKNLQQTNALSKATLLERLAAYTQSEAEVDAIKARIEKLVITAPFDGILGLREVSVGTLVQPGDQITTIDDLSHIKIDFDVPSVYLSVLKPGLAVIGRVEAFADKQFLGTVRTVNTQVDPVTRTVKVRALLPNPEGLLRPGLLMTITLLKNQRQALLIPEIALIKRGEKNFVLKIVHNDGKTLARQTEISIGGRQPGVVEVLSGLNAGEQIIVHGTVKVRDGEECIITAVEEQDSSLQDLLTQHAIAPDNKPATVDH